MSELREIDEFLLYVTRVSLEFNHHVVTSHKTRNKYTPKPIPINKKVFELHAS